MVTYEALEQALKPMNTTKDLAALGIPVSTLSTWRTTGKGPAFVKIGKTVMYPKETVLACFRDNTFTSTLDYQEAR